MTTTLKNTFNIAFFSSSSFILPILENICNCRDSTLGETAKTQWKNLVEHRKMYTDVLPHSTLEVSESIFDQKALDIKIKPVLVVSQSDKEVRGKSLSNPVVLFAREKKLDLFTPIKINDEVATFEGLVPDLDIALVASYGQLISLEVMSQARFGFLNWHPSKLPLYRGSTPMQTCLSNGDLETALSWIEMNEHMDAGDIYLQLQTNLDKHHTFDTLSSKMADAGKDTWAIVSALRVLEGLKSEGEDVDTGTFIAKRQDYAQMTKTSMLTKENRLVDIHTQSAKDIYNHFRAFCSYPGTSYISDYFDQEVKIVSAVTYISQGEFTHQVSKSRSLGEQNEWYVLKYPKLKKVYLKCGEGYLEVEKVCLASGKNIDFAGFEFEIKEFVS